MSNVNDKGGKDHLIEVKLNGSAVTIIQAKYTLVDLKVKLGVPNEYVLDEIVDGQLKVLSADKPIQLHPGQEFVSHVPTGSAS